MRRNSMFMITILVGKNCISASYTWHWEKGSMQWQCIGTCWIGNCMQFKAAVRNFYLFVALNVWKPGIAVSCGIIFRARGCDPVFRHSSSADESNVWRWMCGCQSLHRCGYLLYFAITDSSLRLGIYDPNQNFHRILPSEQVSNKSAPFVLPNWGKKYYNKPRYQWWLNLKIS